MDHRSTLILIRGLIDRLTFLDRHARRSDIFALAPVLIALQDGRVSRHEAGSALAPFDPVVEEYLRSLGRDREAKFTPARRAIRLPLGCRLGLLHFSPLLQLLRLLRGTGPVAAFDGYVFEELPSSEDTILRHLEQTCGWREDLDAVLKRRFGHTLLDYARYLIRLRQKDPILFVLLMAREFTLASRHVAGRVCAVDREWLSRAARLAEVQRLAEMMSYCRGRRQITTGLLRKALEAIVYRKRPSQRRKALREFRHCLPAIRRLTLSVEALRALVLDDMTSEPLLDGDKGGRPTWNSIPNALKREAASRAELLSLHRARHGWTRRGMSMDMYYGIPLEHLAGVAILELSREVAGNEGTEDCAVIAAAMCQNILGLKVTLHRFTKQASLITQVYLRQAGKLGSGGRFDARFQFDPFADGPLFARANALAMGGSTSSCRISVRGLIDIGAAVLAEAFAPQLGPIDPRLGIKVTALITSSLSIPTMDPIFASLLDRRMSELRMRPLDRNDGWDSPDARGRLTAKLRKYRPEVRAAFARFKDLGDRFKDPDAKAEVPAHPHRPLTVQTAPPTLRKPGDRRLPVHR